MLTLIVKYDIISLLKIVYLCSLSRLLKVYVMNFNSLEYIAFLPVTVLLYYILPRKIKNPMLLAASYFFYMCWSPVYALLMLFSTSVTYLCGILVGKKVLGRKKLWLVLSLAINLSILFFFKYYNFFASSISGLLGYFGAHTALLRLDILLPVGISFYTFQALGYTIDVYRGKVSCEKNFIDYALFVSFFPQLVAGPIERTENIIPQLKVAHKFKFSNLRDGTLLILWGMMKKVVIADNLAVIVNNAYNYPKGYTGMQLAFATVCFAFQIYCDFSAYTDIARGSAKWLGICLTQNFNCPYIADSIKDFWRRWHISLSTWFKDYLYFPLGGSRVKKGRHILNVLCVFIVSGLWHGAAFTYIFWGLLHGIYQAVGIILTPIREKFYNIVSKNNPFIRAFKIAGTFTLVCFAWILFRANSLYDAGYIINKIIKAPFSGIFPLAFGAMGLNRLTLASTGLCVAILIAVDIINLKKPLAEIIGKTVFIKYAVFLALLLCIFVFGYYGEGYDPQEFVYFQF